MRFQMEKNKNYPSVFLNKLSGKKEYKSKLQNPETILNESLGFVFKRII